MSAMSRRKGAGGERELFALLRDRLGDQPGLRRNLDQYRKSGRDGDVFGFSLEVKRAERFSAAWIDQAKAEAGEMVPTLCWRRNGKPWTVMLILDIDTFCEIAREAA